MSVPQKGTVGSNPTVSATAPDKGLISLSLYQGKLGALIRALI
jgi:hypothetical protein